MDIRSQPLGILGSGWEVINFAPQVRPFVNAGHPRNGTLTPSIVVENDKIEAFFMPDDICIHARMILETLKAIVKFTKIPPSGDNGWCACPLDRTFAIAFPSSTFGDAATDGVKQVPAGGSFGVPTRIQGICAGDP